MDEFCVNKEKVLEFQEQQLAILQDEENSAGGYDNWYNKLKPFRDYIKKKYIKFSIFSRIYRNKNTILEDGNIIDHHIISYLAPMSLSRIGWNREHLTAAEQVSKLSNYFANKGKRFIYVALPNKGNIYPEIIYNDYNSMGGGVLGNAPQWRKYVREVIESGVETIDIYPVFMDWKRNVELFSKDHHISALGAEIVGKAIANYIKETTTGVTESLNLCCQKVDLYSSDYGNPKFVKESANVYYLKDDERNVYYWNQYSKNSKIAIFGDCNLQSYCSQGASISASLSYEMSYPIYNAGRKLIFGLNEGPIKKEELEKLLQFDIIIYVHFASAPFVRSALLSLRHPSLGYKWVYFDLDK